MFEQACVLLVPLMSERGRRGEDVVLAPEQDGSTSFSPYLAAIVGMMKECSMGMPSCEIKKGEWGGGGCDS